jgi:hypothetical protein
MKFSENEINLMRDVFGCRPSPKTRSQPSKYGVPLKEGDENWAFAQELVRSGAAVLFNRDDGSWNLRASFIADDGGEREFWKP